MLGDSHERLSRAQPSKLPDSGHCSGDAGDDAPITTIGEDMDPTYQAVGLPYMRISVFILRVCVHSIILDEIHTIGQQEGGAVWEQIILLAPCPLM